MMLMEFLAGRRSATVRLLWLVIPFLAAEKGLAQFTDPITTTPTFLQDGFGPAGDLLPFGGQEYCVPTAVAMSLSYLGTNGYNQIGPATATSASELNMVRVMSGLMNTDAIGGTYYSDAVSAIVLYLAAEGISTANYTLTVTNSPTLSALADMNQPGTVVDLFNGYYNTSGSRTGGHAIALVGQGTNSQGQASPSTIIVKNPLPGALAPQADVAGNSLQYLNTIPTSGNLTTDGAIRLDPSQYPGFWGGTALVIEQAISLTINPSQKSVNNPSPATWTLGGTQAIKLNSGTMQVLAPITGQGGIALGSFGVLQLNATDTTTGATSVTGGTLASTITSGHAFGDGYVTLDNGTLQLSPTTGSSNISVNAATGNGKSLTFLHGSEIALALNGNTSLQFNIGQNTDGTTANLARSGAGTLIIAVAGGTSDLGQAERVILGGTGGNLPQNTNGIVAPYIVGQNNDSFASGDFLSYGASSIGFTKAAYTAASSTPIAAAGSNAVFLADIGQTIASSATVQLYALNVQAATLGGGASSVLQIGSQTGGQGGVILNGGTIGVTNLVFGSSEGVIYTSSAGGTISSVIQGRNGLTTFGPGILTLQGANTYTGTTNINSGTLLAQNTSGSATGSGPVIVQSSGTLEISGASAKAGGTGGTTVQSGGALLLVSGSLSGSLTMAPGSYLFGKGTIAGAATVSGTIGNSGTPSQLPAYTGVENITFTGATTFNSNTIYSWKLNALDAAPADAGTNWSLLQFTGNSANLGLSGDAFNFTLDLGAALADPNSGNPFWSTSHQWLVADDAKGFNSIWWFYDFPAYAQGSFSLSADSSFKDLYVNYTANVPEPGTVLSVVLGLALIAAPRRRKSWRSPVQ